MGTFTTHFIEATETNISNAYDFYACFPLKKSDKDLRLTVSPSKKLQAVGDFGVYLDINLKLTYRSGITVTAFNGGLYRHEVLGKKVGSTTSIYMTRRFITDVMDLIKDEVYRQMLSNSFISRDADDISELLQELEKAYLGLKPINAATICPSHLNRDVIILSQLKM